jgi:ATP-binding cassette, subfamily B, bacterial
MTAHVADAVGDAPPSQPAPRSGGVPRGRSSLLWLTRYLGPHRGSVAGIFAAMIVTIGMDILRPWPMKVLIDQVLGHRPFPPGLAGLRSVLPLAGGTDGLLVWAVVGTLAIYIAGAMASMVETVAAVTLGQRMVYALGSDLFLHLQRLSLTFHRRRPVADTISRVTVDSYCVQALINNAAHPLLRSAVTLAAMFAIMWHLDHKLTVLALLVAPFLVLTIRLCGDVMRRRHRERRDLEGRLMAVVEQVLGAIPAVQAFAREERERARFQVHANHTAVAYLGALRADVRFSFLVGLATAVGTAAIMWVGAEDVLRGQATVGTLLVFLSYLGALYAPLQAGVSTVATVQAAVASADRVVELFRTAPDVSDGAEGWDGPVRGRVCFENVAFGYDAGRPVLHGVSFDVRPGERIAVVGPTGAGKTTLVNLLVRFFDPWAGRVTIDGRDIRRLRVRPLREQVALVMQEPFIFPMTVAENIAYGRPEATRDEIVAAAAVAGADEFIRRLPDGYETLVGEKGATLSGGERQQLSIARAFLKNAPILVLDEPTSAMDPLSEVRLLDALERLAHGRTTFVIAHRLTTIARAERILVMNGGTIVEDGSHDDLLARNGLYARLARRSPGTARSPLPAVSRADAQAGL